MRVALFTREFPPDVYGGAGVHVEYLADRLSRRCDLSVLCFGQDRPGATAAQPDPTLGGANAALQALSTDLRLCAAAAGCELAHSHTWYANLAGHLAKLLYGAPHVVTSHSLEPRRPWKAEQLGGGYALSSWAERTAIEAADAVIAVSAAMRADILDCYPALASERVTVIHNGIDTDLYKPDRATGVVESLGMDPARPSVVFVGRITRQKGLEHLLAAARHFDPQAQLILLAGAPDTPEIAAQTEDAVAALARLRDGVVWVREMLPKQDVIQVLTHATVFCCPSVYEPMGIVNLEAMACETAVVATATGGIPEVVADGETGLLVPIEQDEPGGPPKDPEAFALRMAETVNSLVGDPARAASLGQAGRARAVELFSWDAIAERTMGLYRQVLQAGGRSQIA
jgi:starch synthase